MRKREKSNDKKNEIEQKSGRKSKNRRSQE